jgi:hypothetical protein
MNPEIKPDPRRGKGWCRLFWLMVGFLPIPILLILAGPKGPDPLLMVLCFVLNFAGGLGCVWRLESRGIDLLFGLILGFVLFGLSLLVALFQSCS